jgi:hypothetical protein
MKRILGWVFLMASGCAGTGGTETDNPASLEDFASSDCKTREAAPDSQALTLGSEVDGLSCVEWERPASGKLTVRLLNFSDGCAKEYLGRADKAPDGALELAVYTDSCSALKCGDCLYDFEFRLAGVAKDAPLALRLGRAQCESEATTFDQELTLPLDEQEAGIVCKQTQRNALEDFASNRGACGQRNMPCGDCGMDQTACDAGLQCTEVGKADARCLAICEVDADCVADLSCQAGVCRAKLAW